MRRSTRESPEQPSARLHADRISADRLLRTAVVCRPGLSSVRDGARGYESSEVPVTER